MGRDLGKTAEIALRINPDVDPGTHPYIATGLRENKFGVPFGDAVRLYEKAQALEAINPVGIACHIGSQLTQVAPFCDALEKVLDLVAELKACGIALEYLDLGGGLGIRYADENPPSPREYIEALLATLKRRGCEMHVTLEPGRAIVGNAGILLTKVEYTKAGPDQDFAIVDAAMNDLLRPALYQAFHEVVEVDRTRGRDAATYDIVGPVCESGDFLARGRTLSIASGDLLAVRSAGAYGFVMSSNYNARPRPAEVMVDGDSFHVVRDRESTASLFQVSTSWRSAHLHEFFDTRPADRRFLSWAILFTLVGASLNSIWCIYIDDVVNNDAVEYIRAAERFAVRDWAGAFAVHQWPFFSALMWLTGRVFGISYEAAGYLLNSVFFSAASVFFVLVVHAFGGTTRRLVSFSCTARGGTSVVQ